MNKSYEQQALDLVKQNEALKRINIGLANLLITQIEDDKPTTLTWLTQDDLIEYSDVHQAGGINAIKADAIEDATRKALREGVAPYNAMMLIAGRIREK